MMDFVIIVLAILAAQIITAIVAVKFLFNDRVVRWYARKTYKMMKNMEEEMEVIQDEED